MFTAIATFFAVGAIGFYILMGVLAIVLTVSSEKDIHGLAVAGLAICALIYHATILAFIAASWKLCLVGILLYGVFGGAWSLFRWFRYCKEFVATRIPDDDDLMVWADTGGGKVRITPTQWYRKSLDLKNHKSRLIGWIVYWPFSAIWNITGDFFNTIFDFLSKEYRKITEYIVNKAINSATRK